MDWLGFWFSPWGEHDVRIDGYDVRVLGWIVQLFLTLSLSNTHTQTQVSSHQSFEWHKSVFNPLWDCRDEERETPWDPQSDAPSHPGESLNPKQQSLVLMGLASTDINELSDGSKKMRETVLILGHIHSSQTSPRQIRPRMFCTHLSVRGKSEKIMLWLCGLSCSSSCCYKQRPSTTMERWSPKTVPLRAYITTSLLCTYVLVMLKHSSSSSETLMLDMWMHSTSYSQDGRENTTAKFVLVLRTPFKFGFPSS